jgi:hypothetical protein
MRVITNVTNNAPSSFQEDRAMQARFFRPLVNDIDFLVEVEKLAWSSVGKNIEASREKLRARIESHNHGQSVVLAMINGNAAGSQYAFRFNWDENVDALRSWDEYTAEGCTDKVHNPQGTTGFLVGVGVVPVFRGIRVNHNLRWSGEYKISELLIAATLDNLFTHDCVRQVIANARIPFYHKHPEMSVDDYCSFRREDGKLFDPVLRFHERMGAQTLKPVAYSMDDQESLNGGCWVIYRHPFKG